MKPVVLLVDNDKVLADMMAAAILQIGLEVRIAYSYAEGMRAIDEPFDVIISDYDLGDGLGTDLLVEVQKRYPKAKRVLITGSLEPINHVAGEFWQKPVNSQTLHKLISQTESTVA